MIFMVEGERPVIGVSAAGVVLVIRPKGYPAESLLELARLVLCDADLAELAKMLALDTTPEI
jgi:hypothetical protein